MALKVIATGLPRTGTSSLKVALQTLGFGPCQHMDNLFNAPHLVDQWIELFETGTTDFKLLFADFQSITDFPGCLNYRQLLEAYPDAKVILNRRDPESWYESLLKTVYAVVPKTPETKAILQAKGNLDAKFKGVQKGMALVEVYLLNRFFDGDFLNKEQAIKRYLQHEAEVRAFVPANQLLELPLGAGWEPLCDFLDVSVPAEEYPYKNKRHDFLQQLGSLLEGGGTLQIK